MISESPLISIIIPAYNAEKYICRCLNSIFNQTYEKYEIVLIDDGSSDNTLNICEEFAAKDTRLKVFHQENRGQAAARNVGIDNCSGEYISFIDSDDYIHPMFLEALLDAIQKSDSDISMCYHHKSFSKGNQLCNKKYDKFVYVEMSGVDAALKYVDADSYVYICPCNKLYKRKLFDCLRFPVGQIAEDCFLLYRVFLLANKVSVMKNELYFYYMNRNSTMHIRTDFADYNFEAYKLFYNDISEVISAADLKAIKLPMLYLLIDFLSEDYWRAYLKSEKSRKQIIEKKYVEVKKEIIKEGGFLKLKYKLYEFNKFIYVVARQIFEIKSIIITEFEDIRFVMRND